ncbi:pentraxin-related protein PTX3 [Trichechus manatus latirostris]|uniref:Pentraxin-related protein PTX3 n=1 Tax=Trichechus manatus latirostris TaxID=127582 RepID=A0A2Y9R8E7_TRIMA|nr:pentraxin-related protein PTX3 [Trichechus manatus latirostris]
MNLPAILFCAFWAVVSAENSDDYDLMYVNLDNEIDNGIHSTEEPTPCDCRQEHSDWDKLFTMLENSQMREGMLLQAMDGVLGGELQRLRAELGRLAGSLARPSCETAILFPMRSKKIFGSVHPVTPMKLESFSACLWVKATDVFNKTILFSYGTKRNPYEIQLYLSYQSTVLVVGGEGNRLVADTVISVGRWTHLCGTWASETGRMSLWVNGELAATAVKMVPGHVVPEGGILQIGQEKNGCCVGGGFDETLAFSGRLTGFNIWDHVLSHEEIRETGEAESCHLRGNVVGWGVTEIQPHGGAQYIL